MVVIVPVLVLLVALGVFALETAIRRRRKPAELRGDWWGRFEREMHADMARASETAEAPWREPGTGI